MNVKIAPSLEEAVTVVETVFSLRREMIELEESFIQHKVPAEIKEERFNRLVVVERKYWDANKALSKLLDKHPDMYRTAMYRYASSMNWNHALVYEAD